MPDALLFFGILLGGSLGWLAIQTGAWAGVLSRGLDFQGAQTLLGVALAGSLLLTLGVGSLRQLMGSNTPWWDYLGLPLTVTWVFGLSMGGLYLARKLARPAKPGCCKKTIDPLRRAGQGLRMEDGPALVVLAAGMGSRYGGLKQLDGVGPGGETILDYSVFDAIRAGFSKVVYIIREDFAKEFREKVGGRFAEEIGMAYVFQDAGDLPEGFLAPEGRTRPWGTGHAAWAARGELDRPFALINADDFYGAEAFRQVADFLGSWQPEEGPGHYCMVGYRLEKTLSDHGRVNRGLCETRAGLLNGVEEILKISQDSNGMIRGERKDGEPVSLDPGALVSMNMWGFPTSFVAFLESGLREFLAEKGGDLMAECYIPAVVDSLIRNGRAECEVLATEADWFGVTYPEDRAAVAERIGELVAAGLYPVRLQLH